MTLWLRRIAWIIFIIFFFAKGDLTHYTWITLLLFGMWLVLGELDMHHVFTRTLFWVTINVIVGIYIMSQAECKMLLDAHKTYGDIGYIILNFSVHYMPSLILFISIKSVESRWDSITHIIVAFCVFLVYVGLHHPSNVYGCDNIPNWFPTIGALGLSLLGITMAYLS